MKSALSAERQTDLIIIVIFTCLQVSHTGAAAILSFVQCGQTQAKLTFSAAKLRQS
jgi:hypothetical protein